MPKDTPPISSRAEELRSLDRELTALLAKRAALVAAIRPQVPSQAKRKQWLDLEKELWQIWDKAASSCRSDVRTWRKIFSLAQELHSRTEAQGEAKVFTLAPKPEPVRMRLHAPGCTLTTRLWALLASQTHAPFTLSGAVRNDHFVELIKALNQAGASLFWDDDGLHGRGQGTADFNEGVIFAGEDTLNLYLLVAACLGRPGAQRFTGSSSLKQADLNFLRHFLPQLGARIAFMHPGSSSVPFRLECSGILPDTVRAPGNAPADCIMAVCLAAPMYPNGLAMHWDPEREKELEPRLALVATLLRQCGVEVLLEEGRCSIPHAALTLPQVPLLPPDPLIAANLLAFARVAGGSVSLECTWPELTIWSDVLTLLRSAGLDIQLRNDLIAATPAGGDHGEVRLPRTSNLLPVAFALAANQALKTGGPERLHLHRDSDDFGLEQSTCTELCSILGLDIQIEEDICILRRHEEPPARLAFVAPDARWCMALALLSHARPGLELANPGSVAELLPGFWMLFNALPAPGRDILSPRRPAPKTEEINAQGKRRRIRL
jgi:3-phosphoshikimate 1-carboxyvinyltransferase